MSIISACPPPPPRYFVISKETAKRIGYTNEIFASFPFFKKIEIMTFDIHRWLSNIISPYKYVRSAIPMSAAIFIRKKNLWRWMLETNRKQVLPKRYSLKISIDSVNEMSKIGKTKTWNTNILTRNKDHNNSWGYSCSSNNKGPGPYDSYVTMIIENNLRVSSP